MRKEMNQLSAPEAQLLMNRMTSGRDLMKLTLKELVLKRVLRIEQQELEEEGIVDVQVGRGTAFTSYQPQPHEMVFLASFKDDDLLIELSLMQKGVLEWIKSPAKFRLQIIQQLCDEGLLGQNFFQKIFQLCSLTEAGKPVQQQITESLELLGHYRQQEQPDGEQLRALITKMGSVVLLSEHVDPEWVQSIFKQEHSSWAGSTVGAEADVFMLLLLWNVSFDDSFGAGDGGWGEFDGGGFDSGWGSDGGSDGGGCSADGGGGCSGCGGCGGCGG